MYLLVQENTGKNKLSCILLYFLQTAVKHIFHNNVQKVNLRLEPMFIGNLNLLIVIFWFMNRVVPLKYYCLCYRIIMNMPKENSEF